MVLVHVEACTRTPSFPSSLLLRQRVAPGSTPCCFCAPIIRKVFVCACQASVCGAPRDVGKKVGPPTPKTHAAAAAAASHFNMHGCRIQSARLNNAGLFPPLTTLLPSLSTRPHSLLPPSPRGRFSVKYSKLISAAVCVYSELPPPAPCPAPPPPPQCVETDLRPQEEGNSPWSHNLYSS